MMVLDEFKHASIIEREREREREIIIDIICRHILGNKMNI